MKNVSEASLSVCLITKNEERFLEDCLRSVKNVASQLIVVDTGSTDRTVAIAKKYGANVHSFDWCDDFSAARNASIKPATGDWILWLDADERLSPDACGFLKKLNPHEKRPVIGQVQINNASNDDAAVHISTAYRLFTNHKGISFKGIIHEQLMSRQPGKVESRRMPIHIDHLGYALEEDITKEKHKRNGRLLERMVRENPNSAYAHFTLAQQYNLMDQPRLALPHFEKAYALRQLNKELTATLLNVWAESCLNLNQNETALDLAEKSVTLEEKQVGGYYLLYKIYKNSNKFSKALKALESIRTSESYIQIHGWQIGTDVLLGKEKLDYAQAELELMNGNFPRAEALYAGLIADRPDDIALKVQAGKAFLQRGKFIRAESLLTNAFQQAPSRLDVLDLLGILYIKTGKLDRAINIYEALHIQAPENSQVSRRLAGLYVKTGEENKAAQLL